MQQNLDDIAELAEDLGSRFLYKGKVNLEKLAKSQNISIIWGNYEDHFLGQLAYYEGQFYIMLNKDKLPQPESVRARFTIAHELGHYFIDEHRTRLIKGESLSFNGEISEQESKKNETAANRFAAHLLMPMKHFIKQAKKLEVGLEGIFILKAKYDTSIECTIKHYIDLDISTSVMIKWRSDNSYHYAQGSKSFIQTMGIKKFPLPIRFDSNYVKEQTNIIESSNADYVETATHLSRWFSTVTQGTAKDILGLEQTVKLGDFGGITLLTFQ